MSPPPVLPDEIIEEIFLRLPPDQPECLVPASLSSKLWIGILTGTRFRNLYHEHHGAPPMLGFTYSESLDYIPEEEDNLPYFVATTKFGVRIPDVEDWRGWHEDYTAWDCRHGRVLFSNTSIAPMPLVVWDPMTGHRRLLYAPEDYESSGAAVLCSVTGCNHRVCHVGPFQVIFIGMNNTDDDGCVAYAHVSLPEVVKWSKPCSLDLAAEYAFIVDKPPIFIQDALYFTLAYEYDDDDDDYDKSAILKYDLVSNCLTLIDAPPVKTCLAIDVVLMAMDDGSLGFLHVDGLTLNLWSRHMGSNGVASWPRCSVINLETLIPIRSPMEKLRVIGSLEGSDIIFVTTGLGIYDINLKSLQWKKLLNRGKYNALFPYMSFYNPPERVSLFGVSH